MAMDDLLSNYSGSNDEDNSCEESLFVSKDLSRYSSPPTQELHMVSRILGVPEIVTLAPEMKAMELALDPKFLSEPEKFRPTGASSGGVLLGKVEKGKEIAPKDEFWGIFENKKPKQQNPIIRRQPSSSSNSSSVNKNDLFEYSTTSSLSFSSTDLSEPDDDPAVTSLFTPVNLELEPVEKKRKRKVKTAKEAEREKIREKIRYLQRLIPGGSKPDTVSVLDETISYLKFLKVQKRALEGVRLSTCTGFNPSPFLPFPYFHF